MLSFTNGFEALERFELIRGHLAHAIVLRGAELAELQKFVGDRQFPETGPEAALFLTAYQELLAAAMSKHPHAKLSGPVLPDVNLETGCVRHGTHTSNTVIEVNVRGRGLLRMERPGEAIDPNDGFRTALAVLTGYLAGWDRKPVPEHVIDPRVSARPHLVKLFGEEAADRLLAGYVPHWGSWELEQRVARMEKDLKPLRELRRKLHSRTLNRPSPSALRHRFLNEGE